MSSLFGGSKSKSTSESGNKAYDAINTAVSPSVGFLGQGGNALAALLGGDTSGLNNYKNAMGYDWQLGQGSGDILAKAAAVGGLGSGATLKGLAKYQTGLNNQYGDQYIKSLLGLSDIGANAGQLLTSAGQYSKGTSTSKNSQGIAGGLGGLMSAAAAF